MSDAAAEEKTYTALDILAKEQGIIEEAAAVAEEGWGDENICTFEEGYVDQPVYSCSACSASLGRRFGFCFACSMTCHIDHTRKLPDGSIEEDCVIELFEKRGFRCDCPIFSDCKLHERVTEPNKNNTYNHNFDGLYCWCRQPYDHESDVTMIQCYACQDWFHAACIKEGYKQEIPDDEIESDYVCRDCMKKHPFLQKYDNLLVVVSRTGGEGDVVVKEEPKSETLGESKIADPEKAPQCLIIDKSPAIESDAFFAGGWRRQICRCSSCESMYGQQNMTAVLAPEPDEEPDEADADVKEEELVEGQGDKKRKSDDITPESAPTNPPGSVLGAAGLDLFDSAMGHFMSSFNQIQQVEMLQNYNDLSAGLRQFFGQFVGTGRVVTQNDVAGFFQSLQRNKLAKR